LVGYDAEPGSREGLRKSAQPLTFTLDVAILLPILLYGFIPVGMLV
jgi:hypothetical protein